MTYAQDFGANESPYEPPRTGMATASLVLGIVSIPTICVCVGPLVGVLAAILGLVAIVRANSDPLRFGGRGRAVAGVVLGLIAPGLVITAASLMASTFASFFDAVGRAAVAVNEIKTIAQAVKDYQAEFGEPPPRLSALPLSSRTLAALSGSKQTDALPVSVVANVQPGDPNDWVQAYFPLRLVDGDLYLVYRVGGGFNMASTGQFDSLWKSFAEKFEHERGEPPLVITE